MRRFARRRPAWTFAPLGARSALGASCLRLASGHALHGLLIGFAGVLLNVVALRKLQAVDVFAGGVPAARNCLIGIVGVAERGARTGYGAIRVHGQFLFAIVTEELYGFHVSIVEDDSLTGVKYFGP